MDGMLCVPTCTVFCSLSLSSCFDGGGWYFEILARVKKHSSNKDDPHIRRLVNIASRSSFILNLSFVRNRIILPSIDDCMNTFAKVFKTTIICS
jgi:hypothetical protein